MSITEEQRQALGFINGEIREATHHASSGGPGIRAKFRERLDHLEQVRSALEPQTVTREDAIKLFPFLCDVYAANGDTGTEFILWLRERGIEVEEGK